jgi:hypothetical protein
MLKVGSYQKAVGNQDILIKMKVNASIVSHFLPEN